MLGFETENERVAGAPLCVTLYWQTESVVDSDYTVFLHLVAPDGFLQAQRDSPPAFGFHPTNRWQVGQVVTDMHCLQLPPGLARGQYDLLTGLYAPGSGQRLDIIEGGSSENGSAILDRIKVFPTP